MTEASTADTVTVEPYTASPETADALARQVERFCSSGLNGALKNIYWDAEAKAMNATFIHDGLELKIVSSETFFTVEPIHAKPIEPGHAEQTRQGSPTCIRRITPEIIADAVINSAVYALLGYAWASGKVGSTERIRFDLPLTSGLYGGRLRTQTEVQIDDAELALTLTGDNLKVVAFGGDGTAEEQLTALLEQVGATRDDLIASLKACQDVSISWHR